MSNTLMLLFTGHIKRAELLERDTLSQPAHNLWLAHWQATVEMWRSFIFELSFGDFTEWHYVKLCFRLKYFFMRKFLLKCISFQCLIELNLISINEP